MLKNIFKNILFLYKNIFHWNISKILISLSSYLLGIGLSIPFFLIFLILIYLSPFTISQIISIFYALITIGIAGIFQIFQIIPNGLIWFIFIFIFFITGIFTLFLGIFYSKILLINLNLNYLEKNNLKFKKNDYFNLKLFIKTSKIFSIIFSYLLVVFILFIILSVITYFLFGGSELSIESFKNSSHFKYFSFTILIYTIIFSLIGLFIFYRTYFAYYILVENKDYSALKCIKKSKKITKKTKKILKFILINIILLLLYFPFSYIQQSLDKSSQMLNYYIYLNNKKILKKDFIIDSKINEQTDYNILKTKYKDYSLQELIGKSRFLNIMQVLYFIFNFMFIYGILDLIYANFYKNDLKK